MIELYKSLMGITVNDYDKYISIAVIITSVIIFVLIINTFFNIINKIVGKED